jgi:hypothetical protein
MVVVDDVHLLDEASAAVVFLLATEGHAFVVLTVRSGEPAPDTVTGLWAMDVARRVDVHALRRVEIDALLTAALGGAVDAVSARELRRTCAGNPLLLRELLLAGQETGSLRRSGGAWRWSGHGFVTDRLADVIQARLGALDPAVLAVGELLACGEPLPLSMVEDLAGHPAVGAAERHTLVAVELAGVRQVMRLAHRARPDRAEGHRPQLRHRILRPLRLHDPRGARHQTRSSGARTRTDTSRWSDGAPVPVDITVLNQTAAWAAAEMVSTTHDLNRFYRALHTGCRVNPRVGPRCNNLKWPPSSAGRALVRVWLLSRTCEG